MKNVTPKKHLGQHFLKDENIARKIVGSLANTSGMVIEIGPGMGVLTKYLLEYDHFTAYDIDRDSISYLHETYPDHREKFVLKDFLTTELHKDKKINIIGNFPYNISSQIFFKVYDNRDNIQEVVGMVQKEVGDRIASKEGNKVYGILSVLLQAFYEVQNLFVVKPGAFHPPPKVNSTVIRLKRNTVDELACDEKLFRKVVKMGFGKRRKTLRNALKELNLPAEILTTEVFSKRAEQLSVEDFVSLTQMISK